jgi:predicted amidohydrolase
MASILQKLTWDLGCTLLAVPSAFTKVTGAAHWWVTT